jgi:hypothetical protein
MILAHLPVDLSKAFFEVRGRNGILFLNKKRYSG